ncbi:tyrosyl-tRNA synthetase, mitochondrial-like protein [Corchorus olitorius]|uniref:Tyrosyl-tRNA synthetase, mitochondrial-like protein n=1 Tax=Corchorus olitorius TaxID=93759 RepID=A0A1R3G1J8_9ROSI|nr:tyrosyl-tRNA synthetase, mitochondrial-like protein [Corchorus olitorius]
MPTRAKSSQQCSSSSCNMEHPSAILDNPSSLAPIATNLCKVGYFSAIILSPWSTELDDNNAVSSRNPSAPMAVKPMECCWPKDGGTAAAADVASCEEHSLELVL